MKAVQIIEPGKMGVADREMPQLTAGTVLLKIGYVGFCGSDLSTFLGKNPMVKMPVIPGHEVGATIEAIGEGVPETLQVGQTVTINPYTNCGHCASCRNGRPNACQYNETMGVQRNGAMQQYVVMPWQKVIPSGNITLKHCALIEPMSVGFHAVSRAQVTDNDVVLVIGCGMIGIGAIVRAALRGATVVASDLDDEKLALAQQMGATHVLNSAKDNLHEAIQQITNGQGADVVIEAVGSPITQVQAVEEVSFTGRIVCIGYAKKETAFETKLFVQKEMDIRGSRNAMPEDFRAVIRYLENAKAPLDQLISGIMTPEEAAEGMKKWSEAPAKVFRLLVDFRNV